MSFLKRLSSSFIAIALSLCLLAGCGAASSAVSSEAAASQPAAQAAEQAEQINVQFTVTGPDGESEAFALEAEDGELLSSALLNAGLISAEEAEAGFVTTVNGVTADWDADSAWWCLTDADGEMTTAGVADIALHEGDSYAFTYTEG